MKKIAKVFLTIGGIGALFAVVGVGIIVYAALMPRPRGAVNDLGLTVSDMAIGGVASIESLRISTKSVADAHLAARQAELAQFVGGPHRLTIDYALQTTIGSLGYRSSFYYYCWDIYLPYSVKTESGRSYVVVVQLSDGLQEHKHDPEKFRVLRSMVIDDNGQTIKTIE